MTNKRLLSIMCRKVVPHTEWRPRAAVVWRGRCVARIRGSVSAPWLAAAVLIVLTKTGTAQTQNPLPAPWQSSDVGDVGTTGTTSIAGDGSLFVDGAGADIWGTSDSFRYLYQPIRDGIVAVRVGSETNTHPFAKTGLMIRLSADPGSPEVVLDVKPDGGLELMIRSVAGGETRFLAGASVPAKPSANGQVDLSGLTLTMFRRGATIIAGYSLLQADGGVFSQGIGPGILFPPGEALAGVAVTSHDPGKLNHASLPELPTVMLFPIRGDRPT